MTAEPLPPLRTGLAAALGRPVWRERRLSAELDALHAHPIWEGEGVPEGQGRRVVLVPGFFAGERSMANLAPWLERAGWRPIRPDLGRNLMASEFAAERVEVAIAEAAAEEGAPVVVIGHSRGGQEARVAAVRRPSEVSALVTLGTPHRVHLPPYLAVWLPAQVLLVLGKRGRIPYDPDGHARFEADLAAPFPEGIPFTSVHSRSDGFVDWQACLDPAADNVTVDASHFGLASCVGSFEVVADRLARL